MRQTVGVTLVIAILLVLALACSADAALAAPGGDRGATYGEALAAKAAARAAARRAAARAREARRDAEAVAKYSRMYGSRVGRWAPLVRDYFPGHVADAMYVLRGESGGDRWASTGVCRGLYQIHECHAGRFRDKTGLAYFWGVFVARANVRFAAYMSDGGRDWSAWSVRP